MVFVVWGSVAPEVPARAGVAIEGVGLAGHFFHVGLAGFFVLDRNLNFQPIFGFRESGTAGAVGFVILDFGKDDGELVLGNGVRIAFFVVSDRNRTTPVALARDKPVTHAVSDLGSAVEVAVNKFGFDDGEIELFGKFTVAVVVGGNCHDGAGAVAGENVIGDVNGDFLLGGGINSVGAGEDTSLFLVFLAFDFGFFQCVLLVFIDGVASVVSDEKTEVGVFGSDY